MKISHPFSTELLTLLRTPSAIHAPEYSSLSQPDWEQLAQLAHHQNVAPILYHLLKNNGADRVVPASVFETLRRRFKQNTLRNLKLQTEFHRAITALHRENIPVLALKGMILAAKIYPVIGMRRMVDIDLLFRQDDIPRAVELFQSLGYVSPRKLAVEMEIEFADMHHIPPMKHPNGTTIELHARLIRPNVPHAIPPETWWADLTATDIAGVSVQTLNPVAFLLHLCEHISYHHTFRIDLRHYYDLMMFLNYTANEIDWDEFSRRVQAYHWEKGIAVTLTVLQQLFAVSYPDGVLESIASGAVSSPQIVAVTKQAIDEMWRSFPKSTVYFSHTVANFEHAAGISGKIRYILRRIFIPRSVMAQKYPVAADSFWLNFYYLRRPFDLYFRHGTSLRKLSRRDPEITTTAERRKLLWRWLTET